MTTTSSPPPPGPRHDDPKNPTCCYYTSFLPQITIETQQQQRQYWQSMKSLYFFHSLLNKASPSVLCFQLHLSWCNHPVTDTAHDLLLQNSIPDFSISLLMISSFHLSSPNLISSQINTIELKVQAGPFLLTTNLIVYTNWLYFSLFWGYFAASKRWKQWNFNTCSDFLLHSKTGWWSSSSSCSLSSYLT